MVLPLVITVGLVAVVLLFRNQIKGFADDLRSKANDPATIERQKKIDERGALENTQAFFLGEQGLKDLKESEAQREAKFNQFLADSQKNISSIATGVNTNLVTAQQNLEKFAQESQKNIATSIDETTKNIDTGIKATQTAIDTSIRNTQTAIDTSVKGTFDFFGNIFKNPFGGQSTPKEVITNPPTSTATPKITTSPKGSIGIDLSFLTPDTSLKPSGGTGEISLDQIAEIQRAGRRTFG